MYSYARSKEKSNHACEYLGRKSLLSLRAKPDRGHLSESICHSHCFVFGGLGGRRNLWASSSPTISLTSYSVSFQQVISAAVVSMVILLPPQRLLGLRDLRHCCQAVLQHLLQHLQWQGTSYLPSNPSVCEGSADGVLLQVEPKLPSLWLPLPALSHTEELKYGSRALQVFKGLCCSPKAEVANKQHRDGI